MDLFSQKAAFYPKASFCNFIGMMADALENISERLAAQGLWENTLTLERNAWLKLPDTSDNRVFYMASGCVRMFIYTEKEEHTIRFAYRGNIFTAIDAFFTDKPSALSIQAIRRSTVWVMSKARFMEFVAEHPLHMHWWQNVLQHLILQQLEREIDLLTASPAARYLRVLHRSPQLFQEVPHRLIAAYLRMTPETLSRLKKS